MSAAALKLIAALCLCCTALTGQEGGGVVWRDPGEAVTIQCRPPDSDQEFLNLKRGLMEEIVLGKETYSNTSDIPKEFRGRLLLHGDFPSVDIVIQNLTSNDMGPYWCVYSKFDVVKSQTVYTRGRGSVLLVVTDVSKQCDPEKMGPVLVLVVISAGVLVGIVMGSLTWAILKARTARIRVKPSGVATTDVYEDMRGALRR